MNAIARRRRIEERLRPAFHTAPADDPSASAQIRVALVAAAFVAGPVESLAEVWAQAMGITCVGCAIYWSSGCARIASDNSN